MKKAHAALVSETATLADMRDLADDHPRALRRSFIYASVRARCRMYRDVFATPTQTAPFMSLVDKMYTVDIAKN